MGKTTANKQNQKAQDASRQVAKKFGCCEYSANSMCVFFSWVALSFPLTSQRTKELTPHFVCESIAILVHAPCTGICDM